MHKIKEMAGMVYDNIKNMCRRKQIIQHPIKDYHDNDPRIRHVVILVMENRSFDHILGGMSGVNGASSSNFNLDINGKPIYQYSMNMAEKHLTINPNHYFSDAMEQLSDGNGGFVKSIQKANPTASANATSAVMSYAEFGTINCIHKLATENTVCDQWYSSVPGSTDPNREFIISGTSLGKVLNQEIDAGNNYNQITIFDALTEKNVPWKLFYGDLPCTITNRNGARHISSMYSMSSFYDSAEAGTLPAVSYIEPSYFAFENDMHPDGDIRIGDNFIAKIYNSMRKNEASWKNSLLLITFDENGGTYDHCIPPASIAPDGNVSNFSFEYYGIRVPTIIVSPHCKATVDNTIYDHTSILKYLCVKHDIDPSTFGARTAAANSFVLNITDDIEQKIGEIPLAKINFYFSVSFIMGIFGLIMRAMMFIRTRWLRCCNKPSF